MYGSCLPLDFLSIKELKKKRKEKKRPNKFLKAKPKDQNPKFQNLIIFAPDLYHLELILW
jgi:hypothetical protein